MNTSNSKSKIVVTMYTMRPMLEEELPKYLEGLNSKVGIPKSVTDKLIEKGESVFKTHDAVTVYKIRREND